MTRNIVSPRGKYPWQELIKTPPGSHFFYDPPLFKTWDWKLPPSPPLPQQKGGRDDTVTIVSVYISGHSFWKVLLYCINIRTYTFDVPNIITSRNNHWCKWSKFIWQRLFVVLVMDLSLRSRSDEIIRLSIAMLKSLSDVSDCTTSVIFCAIWSILRVIYILHVFYFGCNTKTK